MAKQSIGLARLKITLKELKEIRKGTCTQRLKAPCNFNNERSFDLTDFHQAFKRRSFRLIVTLFRSAINVEAHRLIKTSACVGILGDNNIVTNDINVSVEMKNNINSRPYAVYFVCLFGYKLIIQLRILLK